MSCSLFRRHWEPGGPEDHASACSACAEWLADQRRAASALAYLAARLDDATRPAEREAELRAAFRQARRPAAEPRQRRWAFVRVAAAACLVAALGFALRRTAPSPSAGVATSAQARVSTQVVASASPAAPFRTTHPRGSKARASSSTHAITALPTLPAAVPADSAGSARLPSFGESAPPHPARLAEAPASVPGATADADGFYPLLPDAPRATLESGQIVRVQLRPDVLDAAGLPRREVPAQGPVEAEVLVGPDGVARGIRLARPGR